MTKHCELAFVALFFSAFNFASAATPAPPKVVFIVDQFTYNWAATPGAFPSNWINQGWANPGYSNCFMTCGGGTSESTQQRFQADVISLHPAIVHIMVGSDDADADDDASALRLHRLPECIGNDGAAGERCPHSGDPWT
jgi:hypothetical protein